MLSPNETLVLYALVSLVKTNEETTIHNIREAIKANTQPVRDFPLSTLGAILGAMYNPNRQLVKQELHDQKKLWCLTDAGAQELDATCLKSWPRVTSKRWER